MSALKRTSSSRQKRTESAQTINAGMQTFATNRSLLNPKFEGYRFYHPDRQEDNVIRYQLENKPTQSVFSGRSPLSFREVQSRITHNHLAVWQEGNCALYIDADYKVVLIDADSVCLIQYIQKHLLLIYMNCGSK
jgi:hypothetical protein